VTRSDEGPSEGDANDGAVLARIDSVEVRESTWAGAYYCAHVLWVATRWARASATSIARDREDDPLVGFIHVPADAETMALHGINGGNGNAGNAANAGNAGNGHARSKRERHATTLRVLACALRGVADELARLPAPRRVLVSGFGPFAAVTSNPTGDLVEDDECMSDAISLAFGKTPAALGPLADGVLVGHAVDGVVVARLRLDVDDACLDGSSPGSLPWAFEKFRPHAHIALGVHRASSIYRVEVEPTTAGLAVTDGEAPRHERGRAIDARDPRNHALARCIERGAKTLGLAR
jgi:hypothetical protein